MSRTPNAAAAPDTNVIRFEVRDGIRRVTCTVMNDALDAVSGVTGPSTMPARRKSFDRFRTLINAAAKLKLRSLPSGSTDPIVLSRDDLRLVPPEVGVPSYGSSARSVARPAAPAADAVQETPAAAPDGVDSKPKLTGDALASHLLQHEAARRAATTHAGGSAPALESTLASISAEVTAEAIERMQRERKPG